MSGKISDNLGRGSGLIKAAGGGAVLQFKTHQEQETYVHAGTTPLAMTEFDMSFQPTSATSKLWLQASINGCHTTADCWGFYFYNDTDDEIAGPVGEARGSRQRIQWKDQIHGSHLSCTSTFGCWYEPGSASSKDYQVWGNGNSTGGLIINRSVDDGDTDIIRVASCVSTFSIVEYDGSIVTISTN